MLCCLGSYNLQANPPALAGRVERWVMQITVINMIKQIESVILENKTGRRLRIYKVENSNSFCIGLEDGNDHFEFEVGDAEEITNAINVVVDSFA